MTPKLCKYNKYPEPSAKKTSLFLASKHIFDTLAKKTALFMNTNKKASQTRCLTFAPMTYILQHLINIVLQDIHRC